MPDRCAPDRPACRYRAARRRLRRNRPGCSGPCGDRAISSCPAVAKWPSHAEWLSEDQGPASAAQMLGLLAELDDRESIETFLTVVVAGGFAKADGGRSWRPRPA